MNKKLVLSVLSTAVVASMASAAMAKPEQGFYIGGEVSKYYSQQQFAVNFKTALKEVLSNSEYTLYVDKNGNIAKFEDALDAETQEELDAIAVAPTKAHFGDNVYAVVGEEGKVYNPAEDDDLLPGGEVVVESVSAIDGAEVFAGKEDQVLGFTINGSATPADLAAVEASGYAVEFLASKSVFAGTNGAVATSSTGKLVDTLTTDDGFDYQVVVKKDGKVVAESEFATVKVVAATTVKEITAVSTTATINGETGVVLESNTISIASDTAVKLDATEGTTADGKTKQPVTGETFKSLNPSVALINASSGVITPVKPGTVTFEIKAGEATTQVTYTVVADARVVTSATTDVAEVKLTNNNAGKPVKVTVKDQFGDAAVGAELTVAAVKNAADEEITEAANPTTDSKGEASFNVKPVAGKQGTGTLQVKDAKGTALVSIPVTVGDGQVVAKRVLETTAADNVIDVYNVEDNTITLTYNQYNAEDLLIGVETNIAKNEQGATNRFLVSSADEKVATVAVDAEGEITVTAVAAGQTTILVKEGALTRASYAVVVQDSTPAVATVTFNTDAKVTVAGQYSLSNVIKSLKAADGSTLYLVGDEIYTEAEDGVKVGSIDLKSTFDAVTADASGNILIDGANPAAGQNGTIAISVLDKAGNIVDTFVLEVVIPNSQTPEQPGNETPEEPGNETPEEPGNETPEEPGNETPEEPGNETPEEPGDGEVTP